VTLLISRLNVSMELSVSHTGAKNVRRPNVTKGFTTYRYPIVSVIGIAMYALLAAVLVFTIVVVL
jgi:hypothetical protein